MQKFDNQLFIEKESAKEDFQEIFREYSVKNVFVVGGHTYEHTYIPKMMEELGVNVIRFKGYTPNPKYEEVLAGMEMIKAHKCDIVISVGGGSAIDTAKNIRLFSELPEGELYFKQEYVKPSIPHIAIPTTAGTGSEANENSVLYYNGIKQSISSKYNIPEYVFFEPEILKGMSEYTRNSTLADAIAQSIESIWAKGSTEESSKYAEDGLKLLIDNLDDYLDGDEDAIKCIQKGAFLAGKAIGISKTTAAHAMSYDLASQYGIAHGHSVAVVLPAVARSITNRIDEANVDAINTICSILNTNIDDLYKCIENILKKINMTAPDYESIDKVKGLVKTVNILRLSNNPIGYTEEQIEALYLEAFGIN